MVGEGGVDGLVVVMVKVVMEVKVVGMEMAVLVVVEVVMVVRVHFKIL